MFYERIKRQDKKKKNIVKIGAFCDLFENSLKKEFGATLKNTGMASWRKLEKIIFHARIDTTFSRFPRTKTLERIFTINELDFEIHFMSENKKPKVTAPKYYEPIDGMVPHCPNCGVKFVEPVAANYDYVCPACNESFNVVKGPQSETSEENE